METGFSKLVFRLRRLKARVDGQDLAEYVLLTGLISIAAVAVSAKIATAISAALSNISTTIT